MVQNQEDEDSLVKAVRALYTRRPDRTLHHYTSLAGAIGIVQTGTLYATDAAFMSDASELGHAAMLLKMAAAALEKKSRTDPRFFAQFQEWLDDDLRSGSSVFVTCFSEEGDLLSQWRGYCPDGKGVCLGFQPEAIDDACAAQDFAIVQCIYDGKEQWRLAQEVVRCIEHRAANEGPVESRFIPGYYPLFNSVGQHVYRLAAAFKSNGFSEEKEWRAVAFGVPSNKRMKFREGRSMIVPYIDFELPTSDKGRLLMRSGLVGPTPHKEQAMHGLLQLLASRSTGVQVTHSVIPYRAW